MLPQWGFGPGSPHTQLASYSTKQWGAATAVEVWGLGWGGVVGQEVSALGAVRSAAGC